MIHDNWEDGKALKRIERQRGLGKSIVMLNGCFDLLHIGHMNLLWRAMSVPLDGIGYISPYVVVALNTDDSVRRLKGKGRPFMKQQNRAWILDTLRCVDHVVMFSQDDPTKLFEAMKPDVLVKGSEYRGTEIPGVEHCGQVVYVPQVENVSTTTLANHIAEQVRTAVWGEKT